MCNNVDIRHPDGVFSLEPVNDDVAMEIIEFAAEQAERTLCPHFRSCYLRCLSITNKHPMTPAEAAYRLTDDGDIVCNVFVYCDEINDDGTIYVDIPITGKHLQKI